ncbi:MAG: hypothetical protein HFI09_01950 [Bacilli bacterium]|nr:hypothetical protein [Bacilli bacterium]
MNDILKKGRSFDYVKRVFASFAEIYNYDYVLDSSFLESDKIFFEGFKKDNHYYHYQTQNENSMLSLADMISMAVRIVEAFGVHHYEVIFSSKLEDAKSLFYYLDCLDISYNENLSDDSDWLFAIFVLDESGKKHRLLWGDVTSNFCFFEGFYEDVILHCDDTLKFEDKVLDIVVMWDTDSELEYALYLVQELRLNGFKTEMIHEKDLDVVRKKYATKYVIPIHEEDILNDEVCLMDLYTEEENKVKEMDLIQHLDINF